MIRTDHQRWAFTALSATMSLLAHCTPIAPSGAPTAQAVAYISEVPLGVACVQVVALGAERVSQSFDVAPGQSAVINLEGLPIGAVTFTGNAYNVACAMVVATTSTSWSADAVTQTLTQGELASVSMTLHPAAAAQLSIGFASDAGAADAGAPTDPTECVPTTCAALGVQCGPVPDGCAGVLQCGLCRAPLSCGGGGTTGVCGTPPGGGCVQATCASLGAHCGSVADGCGGVLQCGDCTSPQTCGGGGTPGVCGTPALCVRATCASVGANCGALGDGCGGVLQCGDCTSPQTCGGGGIPNVCGTPVGVCVPTTCASAGANCGPIGDGCGGELQCGTCTSPQTCGGGGTASVCGTPALCVSATCASLGANCGPVGDGCGGVLQCGECTSPQTCGGGGTPNVCGSIGTGSIGTGMLDPQIGGSMEAFASAARPAPLGASSTTGEAGPCGSKVSPA